MTGTFAVNTNQLVVKSTGNVGIGKDPSTKLDVSGDIKSSGTVTATNFIGTWNGNSIPQNKVVNLTNDLGTKASKINAVISSTLSVNTDKLVVSSTGNVGIGTISPQAKLHISGNQHIRNTSSQTVFTLVNHLRPSGYVWNFFTNYSTANDNLHIQNPGGGGGVYMSPGDTVWRSMSDDRLKHNEVEITNGLDVIMKMKPQFYDRSSQMLDANFNGNLDELDIKYYKESGFIAQEVYEIPELRHIVDDSDNDMPWSIIYQQIIPFNTGAIKQLKKEKDELTNKVMELENELNLIKPIQQADAVKIQTLETKNTELETKVNSIEIKNNELETKNNELENKVNTLETQLSEILNRLSLLENN